jgi:serine/threonine protein kinase/tetratricopeptide (TPR) repeat protein
VSEDRLTRAESIFQTAADLPLGDRAAFLAEHCGDDPVLRDLVEDLLERHDGGMGSFLKPEVADRIPLDETPGPRTFDCIGPYRLQERIGFGGMGEVWTAEQLSPVRRTVALKLIKAGMDSRQVLARFEAERQALALMNHPYIAKVFDAGVTGLGHPYFVMEHVPGVPIADYCDQQRLDTKERLKLFERVCEGVQHAHQKAVIHRDIKPSNILVVDVDGKPLPKIIDFGVAKATSRKLSEKTIHTALGQIIGTPEYMSPEQADLASEDVDTRTDVYALGVVLYELLVGALPFDPDELRKAGFEELLKTLRERDPLRPSTKLSTLGEKTTEIARARQTEPPRLAAELKGDLDWIVMRALEKDRQRRYGSPRELAQDIRRHLSDRPVLARPPSAVYQCRKFMKRHRVGVGFAAMAVVILVLFAGTMATMVVRVRQEAGRANREATTAQAVSDFLVELFEITDPYGHSDPGLARGASMTVRQLLERSQVKLETAFEDDPLIRARLLATLGVVYRSLGHYEEAEAMLVEALDLRRRALGTEHVDVASTICDLARLLANKGDYRRAEEQYREALEMRRRLLGEEHADIANNLHLLAKLLKTTGDYVGAEALFRESLEMQRQLLGADHPDIANSLNDLAGLLNAKGNYEGAEPLYRESLEMLRRLLGDAHPDIAAGLNNLAALLKEKGDYQGAESLYRESLEMRRQLLGGDHTAVATILNNLALLLHERGDYGGAEPLYRESLEIYRRLLDGDHTAVATILNNLGGVRREKGDYEGAEPLFREALDMRRRLLGEDHPGVATILNNLAGLRREKGDYEGAEPLSREALEMFRRLLGDEHPYVGISLKNLADILVARGRATDAETLILEALSIFREALPPDHWRIPNAESSLGSILTALGRHEEAEQLLIASYPIIRDKKGARSRYSRVTLARLVALYEAWGRREKAAEYRDLLVAAGGAP